MLVEVRKTNLPKKKNDQKRSRNVREQKDKKYLFFLYEGKFCEFVSLTVRRFIKGKKTVEISVT